MSTATIEAKEKPVRDIFTNDYSLSIPVYQRPYSWTPEQAGALYDDLITAFGDAPAADIPTMDAYFLGSIVLVRKGEPTNYDIVDGQQRIATLTILLAAIRAKLSEDLAHHIDTFLFAEGSPLIFIANHYRLTLRPQDSDFFRQAIQEPGGITRLIDADEASFTEEPQRNIRNNAKYFMSELEKMPQDRRFAFAQYVLNRCYLVVVWCTDNDSAFRVFTILNDRGLDLTNADILKARILGDISSRSEQERYGQKWDSWADALKANGFNELLAHIRMIHTRFKPRKSILQEFDNFVLLPTISSQGFIDDLLEPLAEQFLQVKTSSFTGITHADKLSNLARWLNRTGNVDWIPPAILYLRDHRNEPDNVLRFFTDLERLASSLLIRRAIINTRIDRYSKVLNAIRNGEDLFDDTSPLQLTSDDCTGVLSVLNYPSFYYIPRVPSYVLMRVNEYSSDPPVSFGYPSVSIEHVLPQNPRPDSTWYNWFPSEESRNTNVHRLGNLVLLSGRVNSQANNYEFDYKKNIYFQGVGGSPFPITASVLKYAKWTPEIIEERQQEMVARLKQLWRL